MNEEREELELFWDSILSRNRTDVLSMFLSVPPIQQDDCLAHLRRMISEDGWQDEQRISAQIALDFIESK